MTQATPIWRHYPQKQATNAATDEPSAATSQPRAPRRSSVTLTPHPHDCDCTGSASLRKAPAGGRWLRTARVRFGNPIETVLIEVRWESTRATAPAVGAKSVPGARRLGWETPWERLRTGWSPVECRSDTSPWELRLGHRPTDLARLLAGSACRSGARSRLRAAGRSQHRRNAPRETWHMLDQAPISEAGTGGAISRDEAADRASRLRVGPQNGAENVR